MKQLFLLFLCIFTTDSFASGIASSANNAPCTNNTLETYSGNSNLAADWQPNTIQIRWYNNNTLMDVQSSANTCVYDGALAVPSTAPTRIGYTFDGWTVRPEMDFSTIPTNVEGLERWAKSRGYDGEDSCSYDERSHSAKIVGCESNNTYKELQRYEWKVRYSHGFLYGMGRCSVISGTAGQSGNPTTETGKRCWCKATGYIATDANVIKGPSAVLPWIYNKSYETVDDCTQGCPVNCAWRAEYFTDFQTAFYTPVQ